jgi:hypothetical protein
LKKTKLSQILSRESLLGDTSRKNEQEEFNIALCNPLVKANIPLKKLQNPSFRLFDIRVLAHFELIMHIAHTSKIRVHISKDLTAYLCAYFDILTAYNPLSNHNKS